MKCSINVVLPIPGSPATQTILRLPVHASIPIGAKPRKRFRAPDERGRLGGTALWNDCRDRWRSDYRAG